VLRLRRNAGSRLVGSWGNQGLADRLSGNDAHENDAVGWNSRFEVVFESAQILLSPKIAYDLRSAYPKSFPIHGDAGGEIGKVEETDSQ
jgi:hypothetical protein